jgi:hypothetical protein
MVLEDGIYKELIQANIQDSYAVRNLYSQIGAQVYYNEDPLFYNKNPI